MPIDSKATLDAYLMADLKAHKRTKWRFYDRWRYPVLQYQRHLRRVEYTLNTKKGKLWEAYRLLRQWRLRSHGIKLGFTIYPNTFGPGLSIAHWGTIVVNPNCRVGANCRIHPSTCIGWAEGGVPTLGHDCYLGPGAKLFGPIHLGDHTKVGANAVVTKSFPDGYVSLVGVPAKPIGTQ